MSRRWQVSLRLEPYVPLAPPRGTGPVILCTEKLARVAQLIVHGSAEALESQVREKRSA